MVPRFISYLKGHICMANNLAFLLDLPGLEIKVTENKIMNMCELPAQNFPTGGVNPCELPKRKTK